MFKRLFGVFSAGSIISLLVSLKIIFDIPAFQEYFSVGLYRLSSHFFLDTVNQILPPVLILTLCVFYGFLLFQLIFKKRKIKNGGVLFNFLCLTGSVAFVFLLGFNIAVFWDNKTPADVALPSIVLISIDTLRADHLGCYGYGRNTSPYIDAFSKSSIRFANAITPRPQTLPAMASVMTGNYPHTHNARGNMNMFMHRNTSLAEILKNYKYKTAAFVGNWILRKDAGIGQGFDLYNDSMSETELNRLNIYEKKAPDMNKDVFSWLDENGHKPFFLWVHYQDPHGPYVAPEPYKSMFKNPEADWVDESLIPEYQKLPWVPVKEGKVDANGYRDAYDAEIRYCDVYVGKLLEKLENLFNDTVITIIVADHGESLGEHHYYFAHGDFVYDACSRVPFIMQWKQFKSPSVIDEQVCIKDIPPTLLDMIGVPVPPCIEGKSLWPLLNGTIKNGSEYVFIERHNKIKAVRSSEWKYIENWHDNSFELYNIITDPGEEKNVVSEYQPIVKKMKNKLSGWINETDRSPLEENQEMKLNKREKDILKSLGYAN